MFRKILTQKERNTYENTITSLKAEIYDLKQEVKRLKNKDKKERQIIAKIRSLPTNKKKELGLL